MRVCQPKSQRTLSHNCEAHRRCRKELLFLWHRCREVMGIDRFWSLFPRSSSVLKIADEFLLFGIHTDDRVVGGLKEILLSLDVLKLRVSVRVSTVCLLFLDIHPQRVAQLTQQPSHRRRTHPMSQICQTLAQVAQAAAYPLLLTNKPWRYSNPYLVQTIQ